MWLGIEFSVESWFLNFCQLTRTLVLKQPNFSFASLFTSCRCILTRLIHENSWSGRQIAKSPLWWIACVNAIWPAHHCSLSLMAQLVEYTQFKYVVCVHAWVSVLPRSKTLQLDQSYILLLYHSFCVFRWCFHWFPVCGFNKSGGILTLTTWTNIHPAGPND